MALKITSVFENNERIPERYTCEGENINPPLHIENIPKEAKTLSIIVDDPDAPAGIFVHWVIFNIEITKDIKQDTTPGKEGRNDFKKKIIMEALALLQEHIDISSKSMLWTQN